MYSGGVSPFALLLLTVSYLQSRRNTHRNASLSQHLLSLFYYFGWEFDFYNFGVSVTSEGQVVAKNYIHRTAPGKHHPAPLCVLDPFDPTNDVGVSSFLFNDVLFIFQLCGDYLSNQIKLQRPVPTFLGPMLSSIVNLYPNRPRKF